MKLSVARAIHAAPLRRLRLICSCALAALAVGAVTASSASAFQWWVGTPGEPHELAAGARLPINTGGTVHSPFTLKWLHRFEVKCGGVSYDSLYLEGPVFMGAHSIVFEECIGKKPKHATLVGSQIGTAPLLGEIKPAGAQVAFTFAPEGGVLATFTLKATLKPHHHGTKFHSKECSFAVTAAGNLSGNLGSATKISTEKAFEFDSTGLALKQTRSCVPLGPAGIAHRRVHPAKPFASAGLVLKTGHGPLAAGATISSFSSDVVISSGAGVAECTETELVETLNNNSATKDRGLVQSVRGEGEESGKRCKSTSGPDEIHANNLPWSLEYNSKGQVVLVGKTISFTSKFASGATCVYDAGKVLGTFNTTGVVAVTVAHQRFALNKGASTEGCPLEVEENGHFNATSEGEPVEAELAGGSGGKEEKEETQLEEEKVEEAKEEVEEEEGQPVEGNKGKTGYSATEGWGVL